MTEVRELATALRELADAGHEVSGAADTMRQAASAIEALSTQVEELRGVLKPFALQPERDNQSLSDQWQVSRNPEITMGDLRRAARALASEQTGG